MCGPLMNVTGQSRERYGVPTGGKCCHVSVLGRRVPEHAVLAAGLPMPRGRRRWSDWPEGAAAGLAGQRAPPVTELTRR